jgi:tryptophan-rich sensory protein
MKFLRAVLPLIVGHFAISKWCAPVLVSVTPDDGAATAESIRRIMWSILLVGIGIAWEMTYSSAARGNAIDAGYGIMLVAIGWWFMLWCKNKHEESNIVMILVAMCAVLNVWLVSKVSPKAGLLIIPLLAWVIFVEQLKVPHIQLPPASAFLPSFLKSK